LKRFVLLIIITLMLPLPAWCYDLLIVQSQRSPVYDEVLRGVRSAVHCSERIIVLSDYNEIDLVRIAREENPVVIVTLGDSALAAARKVRRMPVVALMALSFRAGMAGNTAITGVEVQSGPEHYLPIFAAIKARKIGIVCNPARNSAYVRLARKAAAELGIELVVREVATSRDVAGQLNSLAGLVDALWMLPDSVAASGEAADAHFLFSAGQKVPVVTFSSAYLLSGAAIALELDRLEIGKQGGDMVAALLEGSDVSEIAPEQPRKTAVRSNPSVLRRLNLTFDVSVLRSSE